MMDAAGANSRRETRDRLRERRAAPHRHRDESRGSGQGAARLREHPRPSQRRGLERPTAPKGSCLQICRPEKLLKSQENCALLFRDKSLLPLIFQLGHQRCHRWRAGTSFFPCFAQRGAGSLPGAGACRRRQRRRGRTRSKPGNQATSRDEDVDVSRGSLPYLLTETKGNS
ncbi:uncharacterized protein VSU04_016015 isoform 2-T2 [Chlamydotis macqueenii]